MSLISLEMPCSSSSAAPIGIISFTGQYCMPHSVNETSPVLPGLNESSANRQLGPEQREDEDEEEHRGDDVGDGFAARRELHVEHVDAHMLVALIGVGAGQHVLHAVHQEHALVQPVGRRVEREARDHLVVVAEHRDHGPIGDELADADVDPLDRVGEARMQCEASDLRACRSAAHPARTTSGGALARSSASRSLLPAHQARQQDRIADQHRGHQDREPARIAVPAREIVLRRLEIRFGLGLRRLGLVQALLHLRRCGHAGRNLRVVEFGDRRRRRRRACAIRPRAGRG